MFDVNFWGATNVSREAIRFFREENTPRGGRLIVTSSMVAISAVPSMAYYSATKAGEYSSEFQYQFLFNEISSFRACYRSTRERN